MQALTANHLPCNTTHVHVHGTVAVKPTEVFCYTLIMR